MHRLLVAALGLFTVMAIAMMIGLGVWSANQGYSKRLQCFERLLLAENPTFKYSWYLASRETRALLEFTAWKIQETPGYSLCAKDYTEQVRREVLSFEWKRLWDYKKVHDPVVKSVAQAALIGSYQEFRPRIYRCAETFYLSFHPQPWTPWFDLVQIGDPIGRATFYGRKECVQGKKRQGRASGSPFTTSICNC